MVENLRNGSLASPKLDRAQDVQSLLNSIQELIVPHIRAADEDAATKGCGHGLQYQGTTTPRTVLVEQHTPKEVQSLLQPSVSSTGHGGSGVVEAARKILQYSVNTWDRGFLDKLYASPDAAGLAADLLLSTLNTNVHVFTTSPALTIIEKYTATQLAQLFGFVGPNSGGITVPGGAASNTISMLIARNVMFPQIKIDGTAAAPPLAVFTSVESHYSVSAAAAQLGLGSSSVRSIQVDVHGRMDPLALSKSIDDAISQGHKPFYICATAGTTVRGAYDPLHAIHLVAEKYGMWLHIDACWGGPAIFSPKLRHKLAGTDLADSIAINPHKMMGVPMTCSFLLGRDMRRFWEANQLDAGYLFHRDGPETSTTDEMPTANDKHSTNETPTAVKKQPQTNGHTPADDLRNVPSWDSVHDLATYTPQCGRRGDSLKLYLAWQYHGTSGFATQIERAFAAAEELATALAADKRIKLISELPPPCCQVCFYYVGDGRKLDKREMSRVTRALVQGLVQRGWMVDYSDGEDGEFLRAVCNRGTDPGVVSGLVRAVGEVGREILGA